MSGHEFVNHLPLICSRCSNGWHFAPADVNAHFMKIEPKALECGHVPQFLGASFCEPCARDKKRCMTCGADQLPLTVAELVERLKGLPPDARVMFEVDGCEAAEVVGVRLDATPVRHPLSLDGPRTSVVLSASDFEQANKLAAAIKELVDSATDKESAIAAKSRGGVRLTPEDLAEHEAAKKAKYGGATK